MLEAKLEALGRKVEVQQATAATPVAPSATPAAPPRSMALLASHGVAVCGGQQVPTAVLSESQAMALVERRDEVDGRLSCIQVMCDRALEGATGAEVLEGACSPAELSARVCGSVARLEELCSSALNGFPSGAARSTEAYQLAAALETLDGKCQRALSGLARGDPRGDPREVAAVAALAAAKLGERIQVIDELCEHALSGVQDSADAPIDTPSGAPPLGALELRTAGAAPGAFVGGGVEAMELRGIVPRISALVNQLYCIAPRFLDIAEDFDGLGATQTEQDQQIAEMQSHLVATQEEVAALKDRLQSWTADMRELQAIYNGGAEGHRQVHGEPHMSSPPMVGYRSACSKLPSKKAAYTI
mmetsp:Transcript_113389/g.366814  ORF Transcript_113389/g.366814 Transcript_113389/m.366814 type:complete len:360 (-) Transcript_113389:341-1420(-)